eukprot:13477624-Alexandrium_andersonii.AAC.2
MAGSPRGARPQREALSGGSEGPEGAPEAPRFARRLRRSSSVLRGAVNLCRFRAESALTGQLWAPLRGAPELLCESIFAHSRRPSGDGPERALKGL